MRADCRRSVLERFVRNLRNKKWQLGDTIVEGTHTERLIDAAKVGDHSSTEYQRCQVVKLDIVDN